VPAARETTSKNRARKSSSSQRKSRLKIIARNAEHGVGTIAPQPLR
jgi:hypothetical protein